MVLYEASGNPTLWYDNGTTVPPPDPADVYVWWGGITASRLELADTGAFGIGVAGRGMCTTVSPLHQGRLDSDPGVLVTTPLTASSLCRQLPLREYYGELVRRQLRPRNVPLPVASPSTLNALINRSS